MAAKCLRMTGNRLGRTGTSSRRTLFRNACKSVVGFSSSVRAPVATLSTITARLFSRATRPSTGIDIFCCNDTKNKNNMNTHMVSRCSTIQKKPMTMDPRAKRILPACARCGQRLAPSSCSRWIPPRDFVIYFATPVNLLISSFQKSIQPSPLHFSGIPSKKHTTLCENHGKIHAVQIHDPANSSVFPSFCYKFP